MKRKLLLINSNISLELPGRWGVDLRRLALFLICLLSPAYGLDPSRAMSQYVRQHWGTESGFPKGPVYSINQTADGYLWIGTDAGLVRFDGVKFELIPDVRGEFKVASVLGVTPDRDGSLWVRLPHHIFLRYKDGAFENVMPSFGRPRSSITAVGRTQSGELLLWALEGEGSAIVRRGDRFETIAISSGLSRSPALAIAETSVGDIWIGTRDAGLYRFQQGRAIAVTKGLPDLKVNCLLPVGNGELWIGTDQGIVRWNGSELTQQGLPVSLSRIQALSLTRDRDANLWVGTNSEGLLRVNSQDVAAFDKREQAMYEAVTAVFEDREGNLWIGGANGIERLRDSVFVTQASSRRLPSEKSGPVYVDGNGRVWFAPIAGGLYWEKEGRGGGVTADGLGTDVVYSIAGGAGELWIGRQGGGLTRLSIDGRGTPRSRTYTEADGLAQNSVYAVHRNRDGTVWAGTLSGGVSRLKDGKFMTFTSDGGLASNTVTSILESVDGTMWFATPNGLSEFANGRWRNFGAEKGLPSQNVNCLFEDSAGTLWVGAAAGLCYRNPSGGFESPPNLPAALKEAIFGVAQDQNGALWIATSNHVMWVKRDELMAGKLGEADRREFGIADGLLGVEGVKRHRSVATDGHGQIWFSLNRGLSTIDPERLRTAIAPALVHIQSITADGSRVDPGGPIQISAARQRVTFSFVGLSLAIPERVKFRYRLENFDSDWSRPSSVGEAIYTNLNPGVYRFRVIASNTDGVWSSDEAVIGFRIKPIYWQTWSFRLSVALGIGLMILSLMRIRMIQLTRRMNLRFEERLAERTRIAQELHDTLLQGFLSASMQLQVAENYVPGDSPAKPILGNALKLIGQVIDEGRNAIRGIRVSDPQSLDLEQVFTRVRDELDAQPGNGMSTAKEIGFRVIVEGRPRALHPILRDEVYRIGREALVNAYRHAGADHIEVELEYTGKQMRILVRDDGCGIDPQILGAGRDGHWGLIGMRERAERIGARLRVRSAVSSGTEVELSIPGQIAFESQRSRSTYGK
jgi:ligand-binding sensor domain-containing protein/signal transduction histidine kinase